MHITSSSQTMWHLLLSQPMAILGPYKEGPPSLSSFAPHAVRIENDRIVVAGQFLELPISPPESWFYGDRIRAYAVFDLVETRHIEVKGSPPLGLEDDSLHGVPVGQPATCSLIELSETFLEIPGTHKQIKWRKFHIASDQFSLQVEAGCVALYCGRQAPRQYWG